MKSTLQIQGISAAPGTKAAGFLNVPTTTAQMPITIVNGVDDGQTLLITAGVHGGEYPCIEAAIRFAAELNPAEISGAIIVMPIVSLNSFHARQAFLVPEDGKNLNRVFPGKATGTISERMAYAITSLVAPHVQAWVDMHGGDIPEALVPFSGYIESPDPKVNEGSRGLAAAFGIEYLLRPDHLPGTSNSAAAAMGIPALLAEAGQLGILDEDSVQILLRGCYNVSRHLGILPGSVTPIKLTEFKSNPWVRAGQTGCWYPSVKLGDTVEAGQKVGEIKDYFGNLLAEYHAPCAGLVILLCAALAVNGNDPLVGIGEF